MLWWGVSSRDSRMRGHSREGCAAAASCLGAAPPGFSDLATYAAASCRLTNWKRRMVLVCSCAPRFRI